MEFHEELQRALDEKGWDVPELRVELRKKDLDLSESTLKRILSGEGRAWYELIVLCGEIFGGVERFFPETCKASAE